MLSMNKFVLICIFTMVGLCEGFVQRLTRMERNKHQMANPNLEVKGFKRAVGASLYIVEGL